MGRNLCIFYQLAEPSTKKMAICLFPLRKYQEYLMEEDTEMLNIQIILNV